MTLAQYVRRRNGVPLGARGSLRNMLTRFLGAASFAGFWRHWNPLFGYYLHDRCYRPLVRFVPRPAAVVLTFAVSGALHDGVASLATTQPFVLFTPAFALFGLGVVVEERLGWSLSGAPVWLRAATHATIVVGTLAGGVVGRSLWL